MPDPSSNKVYRLQVGAYSTPEAADRIARQVASLGFQVMQEMAFVEKSGMVYRVLAVNVPAGMVQYAALRLASTGIKEIWVRE